MSDPLIEFDHVTVLRDGVTALDRLSVRIDDGERVAVVGPTASAKSTLVLDEPAVSLDIRGRRELFVALPRLRRAGESVVLVTHGLEDVTPEIDRIVTRRDGRVLHDGPTREILRSGPLSELFGVDVHVAEREGVWHMW